MNRSNTAPNARPQPTEAESEERRGPRRLPLEVQIEYESTEDFLTDYTANLSLGGMFIRTDNPLELDTRFRLSFRLPEGDRNIETVAVVRWRVAPGTNGPMTPGMGVRFETLSPADRRAVEKLLLAWDANSAW